VHGSGLRLEGVGLHLRRLCRTIGSRGLPLPLSPSFSLSLSHSLSLYAPVFFSLSLCTCVDCVGPSVVGGRHVVPLENVYGALRFSIVFVFRKTGKIRFSECAESLNPTVRDKSRLLALVGSLGRRGWKRQGDVT